MIPARCTASRRSSCPADIKGKNVRPANATEARFVNLLGGASVQVPAPAMRDALAKGTADITESPWGSLYVFGADTLVHTIWTCRSMPRSTPSS